jgi:hypothetical protein
LRQGFGYRRHLAYALNSLQMPMLLLVAMLWIILGLAILPAWVAYRLLTWHMQRKNPRRLTSKEEWVSLQEINYNDEAFQTEEDEESACTDLSGCVLQHCSIRSRIVRTGAEAVRARLGSDVCRRDRPDHRLVIAREWRLWAKDRGLRATHISHLEVYVVERTLLPTIHDLRMAAFRVSAARAQALERANRLPSEPGWYSRLFHRSLHQ